MKKNYALIMLAAVCMVACSNGKKTNTEEPKTRTLVLYYSQTGATQRVAEEIGKQLGADVVALELEQPYDGTFEQTIERCQKEKADGVLPTLKKLDLNMDEYDVVFLGFPVWFGTYATPIAALLKDQTFEGKKLVPFCTFGSGGLQECTEHLRKALPKAEVADGYGIRNARLEAVEKEVERFLVERGYKEGEVEALPAFMEHHPVTEAETKIFDLACGDYQFPLGTPIDVAVRETSNSTDYEYTVKSKNFAGEEVNTTIYVTVEKVADAKPEFTQVIR